MKVIGLLGGMSWESSALYYQQINEGIKKSLGGLHSAKIAMYSVDFSPIEEMQHADELIKRILFLGGLPNLQEVGKLYIGETVRETLECDLKIEIEGVQAYKEAINHCREVNDFVSEDLLKKILTDEEGHVDYLETQLEMIEQMGEQNYIQINSESPLDAEGE